jgi:hypothetical protein
MRRRTGADRLGAERAHLAVFASRQRISFSFMPSERAPAPYDDGGSIIGAQNAAPRRE